MSLADSLTLFFAMIVLALVPGPGIVVVVTRTAEKGLTAGIAASCGIVVGDFVFILGVVSGLSSLSGFLGEMFIFTKYLGAAYLIYLAVDLLLSSDRPDFPPQQGVRDTRKSFIAGLLITLANPKAMLFYLSFFPAFVDVPSLNSVDLVLIMITALAAVGGVMVMYAILTVKAGRAAAGKINNRHLKYLAATVLAGTAVYVVLKF